MIPRLKWWRRSANTPPRREALVDQHFVLLPLDPQEVQVVLDALVAFAAQEEQTGDVLGVVPVADAVAERTRPLVDLTNVCPEQWARVTGLGRYARRPQG